VAFAVGWLCFAIPSDADGFVAALGGVIASPLPAVRGQEAKVREPGSNG